jgi:hypothetical protein
MIHSTTVRGVCALAVVASLALLPRQAGGAELRAGDGDGDGDGDGAGKAGAIVGAFFAPSGAPPFAARAREAFAAALSARAIPLVELARVARLARPAPLPESGPAAGAIAEAAAAYRAYRFAEAVAALGRLEREAEATGGGTLDARQLADIFVYRGLARLELKEAGAAWDDFVRAARIDPTRILDAAEFPPRAVAAHRRAIAEATQVARAELVVRAPPGAVVRVDGREASGGGHAVGFGPHFVRVEAAGYAPWGAVVTVAAARVEVSPTLVVEPPPSRDALLAAAPASARAVILGAVVRGAAGEWRFIARRDERDGRSAAVEEALSDAVAAEAPRAALDRLLAPARPAAVAAPPAAAIAASPSAPASTKAPARRRAWIWAVVVGGAVAVAAIVVPLAVVYGSPATPSAGGALPQP